jgi:hypothetical protein
VFDGNPDANANENFIQVASGTSQTNAEFRLDHNTFNTEDIGVAVYIDGNGFGLIDHNTFNLNGTQEVIQHWGTGVTSWNLATTLGSRKALYIEDNEFHNGPTGNAAGKTMAVQGSRQVVRYNQYMSAEIDQHGTAGFLGVRHYEIYKNTFTQIATKPNDKWHQIRAGSGIIFGDTFDETCDVENACAHVLWEEDGTQGPPSTNARPMAYQIGRGQCSGGGCASHPQTPSDQASEPLYTFLKSSNEVCKLFECDRTAYPPKCAGEQILPNVDFYAENCSGSACTTGGGAQTAGVCTGTRSARQSSCTTGVAYWSTDQGGDWDTTHGGANDGCLDKCTATDTWTNCWYTPFTYPHPLQNASSTPDPPTNFRLVSWGALLVGLAILLGGTWGRAVYAKWGAA